MTDDTMPALEADEPTRTPSAEPDAPAVPLSPLRTVERRFAPPAAFGRLGGAPPRGDLEAAFGRLTMATLRALDRAADGAGPDAAAQWADLKRAFFDLPADR